ncbi:hypothetical protein TVAG_189850 [Trichomonas vaginalis G3]|uniref:Uncharacterized protein n=1 Tax=Trichomonas vaginalis (strain ATCC PRA-98 / G3) TaxID=412133 RepID=A2DKB7_TRIV3|nr:hypothetical protein TVAGG3_0995990 [Trichomonas vaginalis G3]EAY19094.1 hypothetical protein TVAG_189850 [Trichomonas vaginalis G3]KAI5490393.1 hypothetical protein TVAGG3_0995990 [Trichomonas vaginalis G3]|eukprot:XP_001580080.1 hypothetical protein [Trichomonas vaginalis G3]
MSEGDVSAIVYIDEDSTKLTLSSYKITFVKIFNQACQALNLQSDDVNANITNYKIEIYQNEDEFQEDHSLNNNCDYNQEINTIFQSNDTFKSPVIKFTSSNAAA